MSEMKLTPKQREAVFSRGKDVVVSAAAGSGKTSVITRRIVELVCEGGDIRRMLVCTFTNAAAGEMRERIAAALAERAEKEAGERLARQAEYAQMADICTIHKFAGKVVSENHLALGLPDRLRVGEETEMELLLEESMEEVFRELYEAEDENFLSLRARYSGRTDDDLKELTRRLYAIACSRPERLDWLTALARQDRGEEYRRLLQELTLVRLAEAQDLLTERERQLARYWGGGEEGVEPVLLKKYQKERANHELIRARMARLRELAEAGDEGAFCAALAELKLPSTVVKMEPEPLKKELSSLRTNAREVLKELGEWYAQGGSGAFAAEGAYMRRVAASFHALLMRVDERYLARKLERQTMDYDDMLAYAFRALQDEETAALYRGRYDYLFIDEYQDTNRIQDAMLMRISNEGGRFMVGDIKQSIYRFRLADPSILQEKIDRLAGGGGQVVRMNENFRSAPAVLGLVNGLMSRLMSPDLGEVRYDGLERLVPGGDFGGDTEILVVDGNEELEEDEERSSAEVLQAHAIARRILALIGTPLTERGVSRPAGFGDICVLLRSTKKRAELFARVFARYGIPVQTGTGVSAPQTEAAVFMALLALLCDRRSDLDLLAVLRSHIGGFDEDELARVRAAGGAEAERFADALETAAAGEGPLAEKCRTLLDRMERLRRMERGMTVGELLTAVKNRTDYAAHVAALPGGSARSASFRDFFARLQARAARQESLAALVEEMRQVLRRQGSYFPGDDKTRRREDHVQIMSVHGAKGLEFPIVFYANISQGFNMADLQDRLLVHPQLGFAGDLIDADGRAERSALTRQVARYLLRKEMLSEEMRVLYVGMTRAKNKLILCGEMKDPGRQIERLAGRTGWRQLVNMDNPLKWVLAAAQTLPRDLAGSGPTIVMGDARGPWQRAPQQSADIRRMLEEAGRLPFRPFLAYPVCDLPVKLGVSALVQSQPYAEEPPVFRAAGESASAADDPLRLGTLIHLFLQHVDFSRRGEEAVRAQVAAMQEKQLITGREGQQLLRFAGKFAAFLDSELAYRIRRAPQVRREVPFSLLARPEEIGLEGRESVVVQGIIDLLFREEDGWVIVDYKSNMVHPETMGALARHYRLQLDLYSRAVEAILGEPVKEKYLYFLRAAQALELCE